MKKIKTSIKYVLIFLFYLVYVLFTVERRNKYLYGKQKGMNCVNYKDRFFYTDATFHPWEEPKREYLTIKEFFQVYKNWINK